MDYIYHVLIMVLIYIILAVSYDLILGYGGILSIAHAAFYGVGAYASALLSIQLGVPFLPALIAGGLTAALSSLLIAIPSLRIKSYYLIITSFGFQMIVSNVLTNWTSLTRGPAGLSGVPPLSLGNWVFIGKSSAFFFTLVVTVLCVLVFAYLVRSPFGRLVESTREDEIGAQSLGKSIRQVKTLIFMIGSGFAGVAGSLFAHYASFISPDSFTLAESFFIMTIVLIGGAGTLYGPVIGAVIMVALPEVLRFIGLSSTEGASVRQIIIALILLLLLRFNAQGLAGWIQGTRRRAAISQTGEE